MHIELIRDKTRSTTAGTFGRLLIDGAPFCVTCEQPWNDNRPGHSCLPPGDYQLRPYPSPAHGATVVFHNPALDIYATPDLAPPGDAKSRSLCEIHSANWPFQLKGCVAVGEELTDIAPNGPGVTHSVETLHRLMAEWGDRRGLTATIREE